MSELNDDIEKYLKGELTPKQMHDLEKKALSDPFLADALEGGLGVKEFSDDVAGLNRKIKKERVSFTPIRIAAGVVLLIGIALYLYWPFEKPTEIAQVIDSVRTESPASAAAEDQSIVQPSPQQSSKQKSFAKPQRETQPSPVVTSLLEHDTTTIVRVEAAPAVAVENTHTISGTVTTDGDNLPLPGVTVVIKGTSFGTTTDVDGRYSIDVADTASLLFSFVGMKTNEVPASEKLNADVSMKEDASQLEEVVISRTAMPKENSDEPVVRLAEPAGGVDAYNKYLENSRRYPQKALDNDVKGKVIVGFDVGINGELSNFSVIRSLGFGCDEEVMRLVKEGARWNPTTEDSKPVESTVHVKVKFDAGKYKKRKK